ncbi:MAG: GWxTD domain-containing protein [Candidatus Sulfotelmatobacter sp.]|jgi:GWxTD domain-containing protein
MRVPRRRKYLPVFVLCLSLLILSAQAQDRAQGLGVARNASLNGSIPQLYEKWLHEDVRWIITDQERADFKSLSTDKQRDDFVIAFWKRRNPTPGSPENRFKETHYQRIAYANQHFAAGIPGWKTDRGRIYIVYGPPDELEYHSQGRPQPSNTLENSPYP